MSRSIMNDFASIRARADQLSGRDQEPGYKKPGEPDVAIHGVATGRWTHQQLPTARSHETIIDETAAWMYTTMCHHNPRLRHVNAELKRAPTEVRVRWRALAHDMFYQGKLAELP